MKLSFLLRTAGTIKVVVLLAAIFEPNMQITAQAQVQTDVFTSERNEVCLATGAAYFFLLRDIDFSIEQQAEVYELIRMQSEAYERLAESYFIVDDLSRELRLSEQVVITPEHRTEIRQLKMDFDTAVAAVMTPQQQQQYRRIIADENKLDKVCEIININPTIQDAALIPASTAP